MRARTVAVVAFLLLACGVHSQELDVFDISDFVDPRALGAELDERGRLKCPCDSFLVSRLMTGAVTNYVNILHPLHVEVSFAHLATSYYRGAWQLNFKTTWYNAEDFGLRNPRAFVGSPPENRNTVQAARYFAFGRAASPSILRAELTFTSMQQKRPFGPRDNPETTFISEYRNELGFEGDIPFRIGGRPFVTSLVYHGRFIGTQIDATSENQRVGLMQRFPRLTAGRWSLDAAVAAGAVSTRDNWDGIRIHPSVHIISPTIPGIDMRVHLKYAPAILRAPAGDEQWHASHQVALFVDRAIIAKRFSARK